MRIIRRAVYIFLGMHVAAGISSTLQGIVPLRNRSPAPKKQTPTSHPPTLPRRTIAGVQFLAQHSTVHQTTKPHDENTFYRNHRVCQSLHNVCHYGMMLLYLDFEVTLYHGSYRTHRLPVDVGWRRSMKGLGVMTLIDITQGQAGSTKLTEMYLRQALFPVIRDARRSLP